MQKNCLYCGQVMFKPYSKSKKDWINRSKYCSNECKYKVRKGVSFSPATQFKKGHAEIPGRIAALPNNEKHPKWKGDNVTYFALHSWVSRKLGTPKRCDVCGITEANKRYQWANISRKYKRNLSDWKRMCISCHKKYDLSLIRNGATPIFKPTETT